AGGPLGKRADMPALRQFHDADAWKIGEPDLVVRFPAITVPASGPDLFPTLTAPLGLAEDRYIKAIETRPMNGPSRRVVHHSVATMVASAVDGGNADVDDGGSFIVEYASGEAPELYPDNTGVLLNAGHNLNLGAHLHPMGESIQAEVAVGFKLYPKGVTPKYIRYS